MSMTPETRESLILRLENPGDVLAWEEFVAIYRPVIYRLGLARGLQPADAEDLAQQVLVSVAEKISDWEFDPQRAKFRTWLARMVRNASINMLTRHRHDRGTGGTTAMLLINGRPAADAQDSEIFELETKRELYRRGIDEIRDEFQSVTWEAFWLTAVEGLSAAEAAKQVGRSIGAVYVARSRIMTRLQQKIEALQRHEYAEDGP